jgi:alcohol dehydrogenase
MPELSGVGMLRLPAEIRFEPGAVRNAASTARKFGSRVLIIADPVFTATEWLASCRAALTAAGAASELISDVAPELPADLVDQLGRAWRAFAPEVILVFGGGSAIDLAKVLSIILVQDVELASLYGEHRVVPPTLPVVAVPTTAGTGSEVTPVAVVSDPHRELKVGISSPLIIPRAALVDPELTVGAPPSVTAYSGIDALVHAVEAYTARPAMAGAPGEPPVFVGRNDLGSLLALQAVEVITRSLEVAVRDGGDLRARTDMAWGSLLAGMAFGTAGTHWSHALQYPVGAATHTPHGLGTGTLLPYVLDSCRPALTEEFIALGRAMSVDDDGSGDAVIDRLSALGAGIGLPPDLAAIGVRESELAHFADLALGVARLAGNGPLTATRERFIAILNNAWRGDLQPASAPPHRTENQ